jgi:hypothetical protein
MLRERPCSCAYSVTVHKVALGWAAPVSRHRTIVLPVSTCRQPHDSNPLCEPLQVEPPGSGHPPVRAIVAVSSGALPPEERPPPGRSGDRRFDDIILPQDPLAMDADLEVDLLRDIIFPVDSFIGSGGFATVHKAIYKHMPVAVKVCLGVGASWWLLVGWVRIIVDITRER